MQTLITNFYERYQSKFVLQCFAIFLKYYYAFFEKLPRESEINSSVLDKLVIVPSQCRTGLFKENR